MIRQRDARDDGGIAVDALAVLAGLALTYAGSEVVVFLAWAGLLLTALGGVALGYDVVARFRPSSGRLARAEGAVVLGLAGYVAATAVFAAATPADFPMHASVYRAGVVLNVVLVAISESVLLLARSIDARWPGKDTNTSRPK
jgi:hypothetical protein